MCAPICMCRYFTTQCGCSVACFGVEFFRGLLVGVFFAPSICDALCGASRGKVLVCRELLGQMG